MLYMNCGDWVETAPPSSRTSTATFDSSDSMRVMFTVQGEGRGP